MGWGVRGQPQAALNIDNAIGIVVACGILILDPLPERSSCRRLYIGATHPEGSGGSPRGSNAHASSRTAPNQPEAQQLMRTSSRSDRLLACQVI